MRVLTDPALLVDEIQQLVAFALEFADVRRPAFKVVDRADDRLLLLREPTEDVHRAVAGDEHRRRPGTNMLLHKRAQSIQRALLLVLGQM